MLLTIDLDDADGQLAALVEHIKKTASGGHSFQVVVDPGDSEYEKSFSIDGDGAFLIKDVKNDNAEDGKATLLDAEATDPFVLRSKQLSARFDKLAAMIVDGGPRRKLDELRDRLKNAKGASELDVIEQEFKGIKMTETRTDGAILMDALSTLRGRVEVASCSKKDANSSEYEKAYQASNVALREYEVAVQAYRARKIGDDEFVKTRKKRDAAMAIFDKAFNKEASRKDADLKNSDPKKPDPGGKYNAEAVQKEINKDKRIGGKEAKLIHGLLKGRT